MKFIKSFKKAVLLVAVLNLLYFFIEFIAALNIRSVSLLADSIDFIEDASINFLIFFAISLTLAKKAKVSIILSIIMLLPALTALWAIWQQVLYQEPPRPIELSLVAFGALIVNCLCTFILIRFKNFSGSLTRGAFLSARNGALANLAIIFTGIITYYYSSIWPDIIVGIFIAYIRTESALEIYNRAMKELKLSKNIL
jgi:Co/Zn/Cd efflux system component